MLMETTIDKPIGEEKSPVHQCVCCNTESPNYKCPKCFLKYCSVGCYQSHKTNGTCLENPAQAINSKLSTIRLSTVGGGAPNPDDPYEKLKQLIKSPNLREWIKKLDDCSMKEVPHLYETAMEYPEFVEYAQLIGKIRSIDSDSSESEF